jgi:hypothetical protein
VTQARRSPRSKPGRVSRHRTHWAHPLWPAVPDVRTPLSLAVMLLVLGGATGTSLLANRRDERHADVVTKERANVR